MEVSGLESTLERMHWLHLVYVGVAWETPEEQQNFKEFHCLSYLVKTVKYLCQFPMYQTFIFSCVRYMVGQLKTQSDTFQVFQKSSLELLLVLKKLSPKQRKSYQKT